MAEVEDCIIHTRNLQQCTMIGVGAGHRITDARRLILIGRDVGCELTTRPDTWEEFVYAVRDPGATPGKPTIFCWVIPMDEGLDFWGALRMTEPPCVLSKTEVLDDAKTKRWF